MAGLAQSDSPGVTTALIYTRVSTDDQAREGVSLDEQLAESRRYCARQEGWLIGGEYTDVMSGKRDDRPDYQRLLADARRLRAEGRRVAVVLKRLDRFGRRVLERVRCREELKALGVATHSVSEGGEVSDLVANILASVAEEEVRRLGERVRDARRHVAGNGWRPVGVTRWGYRWRAATDAERAAGAPQAVLEIDPETAPYVRETFARVAAGESIHSVTRWIATLPGAARGGRRLYSHSVSRILRAPVYVARQERHDGGGVLEGPVCRWPQLIDDVTWATAQRRILEHTRMPKQASKRYVLTGLLRCPICRGRMVAWARCVGAPRYRCDRDAAQLGIEGRCRSGVLMRPVDAAVLADVVSVVNAVASGDAEFRAALRRQWERLRQPPAAADTRRRIQHLEQVLDRARQRMTRATEMYVDGDLDRANYEALCDKARADLEASEAELARLREARPESALPTLDAVLGEAGGWAAALESADVPSQRDVLGTLVDHVVPKRISRGKFEVEITWTPLGEGLRRLTGATASTSAA